MNRDQVLQKAKEILLPVVSHREREPGWPYRHGWRTANLALWLRARLFPSREDIDDILYAAALFHDCAKDDGMDHGDAGAVRAADYLAGLVSQDELPVITGAIARHNKRGEPSTDLEKLLQDADIIDHFGTIEVWLNVSYSALTGSGPERSLAFYDTEWEPMVTELRGMFNFELARSVFDDRIAYNNEFIRRLRIESAGGVVD